MPLKIIGLAQKTIIFLHLKRELHCSDLKELYLSYGLVTVVGVESKVTNRKKLGQNIGQLTTEQYLYRSKYSRQDRIAMKICHKANHRKITLRLLSD